MADCTTVSVFEIVVNPTKQRDVSEFPWGITKKCPGRDRGERTKLCNGIRRQPRRRMRIIYAAVPERMLTSEFRLFHWARITTKAAVGPEML